MTLKDSIDGPAAQCFTSNLLSIKSHGCAFDGDGARKAFMEQSRAYRVGIGTFIGI